MTIAVCWENAHLFGDVMPSMMRLRHRCFIDRQGYDVSSHNGMEYDQYDTPASWYFLWRDGRGTVRGAARLNPTTRRYMLKDLWPRLVEGELPSCPRTWEGTRFCVDKNLPAELRRRIVRELVQSYAEFCQDHGIARIVGVMPPPIWRHVFDRAGWPVEYLGQPAQVDEGGSRVVAGALGFDATVMAGIRGVLGHSRRLLHYEPYSHQIAVAQAA